MHISGCCLYALIPQPFPKISYINTLLKLVNCNTMPECNGVSSIRYSCTLCSLLFFNGPDHFLVKRKRKGNNLFVSVHPVCRYDRWLWHRFRVKNSTPNIGIFSDSPMWEGKYFCCWLGGVYRLLVW